MTNELRTVIEAADKWADYLDGNEENDEAETITVAINAVKANDTYARLETAAHSVVNAFYAKWTRGDMRGPIERLREVLSA